MNTYFYQIAMAVLIIGFLVARAPFILKYRKSYKTQASLSSSLTIDKVLVGVNSVAWVVVPLVWCSGIITIGAIYLPDLVRGIGILLYIGGLLMMWASNYYLKDNWSAIVEVRESHELIQRGVYKYIRHPMYTAFYMQVFGLLLISSNLFVGLIAIGAWQALYMYRIDKEEALLVIRIRRSVLEISGFNWSSVSKNKGITSRSIRNAKGLLGRRYAAPIISTL